MPVGAEHLRNILTPYNFTTQLFLSGSIRSLEGWYAAVFDVLRKHPTDDAVSC
jgi:hypothetical protein